HNYIVRVAYSGTGETQRGTTDVGHTGVGIWLRGTNNYIRDNVVNGATKGYTISVGTLADPYAIRIPVAPGADTSLAGQYRVVNMMNTPILEFARNEAGGGLETGLDIWNVGADATKAFAGVQESVIKDFKVWNVWDFGFYNYKTARLTFDGLVARNDFSQLQS